MPTYQEITSPNTGESQLSQAAAAQAKIWKKGAFLYEQSNDYFQEMEGKGHDAIIMTETDTSKGNGQKIEFKVTSGFYGEPKHGSELFEVQADFEESKLSSYEMVVDWIRHATRHDERMEDFMGMRGEIVGGLNGKLGAWLGRLKTEMLLMTFRENLNSANILFAGGKTLDTLGSADTLVWDEVVAMGTRMQPLGGKPAKVGKGMNFRQCITATTDALFSLKVDPDYKQVLRESDNRGSGNKLYTGQYTDIDGHVIKPYNPINHDGDGATASPLNPQATLTTAIAPGTAVVDIKGGTTAGVKYFKYFPGYTYKFNPSDTLAASTVTQYVLVVNPSNTGTAHAGKVGMFSYTTGNSGDDITIVNRLGSATSGARVTVLGDIDWATPGVWAGKLTETLEVGATIIPCNSKGVPFGDTLMFGAGAALRGYGKHRNLRTTESHNGEFVKDLFITSVFGQKIREDRTGRQPGVIRLRHAINYPGLNLPTVA
tara:strand:- start:12333 stop:13790 length:1458 start_codon:yes stop_codon:yes gene_type:complete